MRILILTAIPFWHPGTEELIGELRKKGIFVEALDIFLGRKVGHNNQVIDLLPLPGIFRRIYLKLFRKRFVNKHIPKDVIVDVHFVEAHYSKYILHLPNKIICSLFGSDLYRTNSRQKKLQSYLFKRADGISLSKNMLNEFEVHFRGHSEKYFFNQYGSKRIDLVVDNLGKEINGTFNFPEGKRIVCCGYNAKKEQQHLEILKALESQYEKLSGKTHLIFPLTYGNGGVYIRKLKERLEKSKFSYTLFTQYMSDDEIAKLWSVTDICINMQTTDALSSSIKEALAARSVMLVGEWLPYQIYIDLGTKYEKVSFQNLTEILINILTNYEVFYAETADNSKIIHKFASWDHLIEKWILMYQKVEQNGQ